MSVYFVVVVCGSELDAPVFIARDTFESAMAQAVLESDDLSERADDVWVTVLSPDGTVTDLPSGADHPAR